jgi:hypothetical protein
MENKTPRFIVEDHAGKYRIRDTQNRQLVCFGYNSPPLYATPKKPADTWNNFYSALGFSQKLAHRNKVMT